MSASNEITFLKSLKGWITKDLRLAVAIGLASGFMIILQAWLLANVLDSVVIRQQTLSSVIPLMSLILLIIISRALLTWQSEQVAFKAAVKVKHRLRGELNQHLQKLGPNFLTGQSSGELANTLIDGVDAMENYYARYLPTMSLVALLPLSILVFVFPIDWISGLVLLFTAPLIPFFMILIGHGAEKLNQRQWRKLARMSAHFLDMIQGLTTLKIFNASKREARVIARISKEYRQSTMAVLRVAFLSSLILEFLATVSIAIVAVLIGFRLFYGEMEYLYGFFILLLAPEFYLPLRNMGAHYHARMEAIGASDKIVDILETSLPGNIDQLQKLPEETRTLHVELHDVSFCYEAGNKTLENILLAIPPGKMVALAGKSGSGKSTIAKLLLGFIEMDSGEIRINGQDFSQLQLENWREYIAWVPQQATLFQGTIAENIALGRPDSPLAIIQEAAQQANIHEYIQSLPQQYDTRVGEKGAGLSGGQIQRIALARAFLKDAPLVILDEATAHLDEESEQLIEQSIRKLAENRSLLLIAHRLKTIRKADQIYVMDKGQIVEQGSHQQLMDRETLYSRLVAEQEGGS